MSDYLDFNRNRWNEVSRKRENPYTIPITHEEYERQKDRPLEVILTVGKKVPAEWFERAPGKKLLGLACGGGQQGPMFASHGYEFSHTLEEQIRGQLKQGFAMIDFYESKDPKNRLTAYGSDYLANLCVKL